jgi:RNA polymerase sigma factor (TIGR02999 family)
MTAENDAAGNPGAVTRLLVGIRAHEPGAEARLAELIYQELRKLAASHLRHERADHTLSATALANEVWTRVAGDLRDGDIRNRPHFFGIASTAMRRILVEHARARHAVKRGGGVPPLQIDAVAGSLGVTDERLLALDQALIAFAALYPRQARVVELRFFGGLTHSEIAELLNLTRRTVDRDWEFARSWLFGELGG